MRATRDLLRRRRELVHQRAETIAPLQNTNRQYNYAPFGKKLASAANREALPVAERFTAPSVRRRMDIDLALIDQYDTLLGDVELYRTRTAPVDDVNTFHRLRSVPGIGKILALVLLYEIHDLRRFPEVGNFLSSARRVRCAHESGGKQLGSGGKKIGNPHLRGAFAEAACLFLRPSGPRSGARVRRSNAAKARRWASSPPSSVGPSLTCSTSRSPSTRHASGPRDAGTSCEDFAGLRTDDPGTPCRPRDPREPLWVRGETGVTTRGQGRRGMHDSSSRDPAGPVWGADRLTGAHQGRGRRRRRQDESARGAPAPQVSLGSCS